MARAFSAVKVRSQVYHRQMLRRMDSARLRWLKRVGALVRRVAQNSIKRRKAISRPGEPPSGHNDLLKKCIVFVVPGARARVVRIGPAVVATSQRGARPASGTIPDVLEFGGRVLVSESQDKGGRWQRVKGERQRGSMEGRVRQKSQLIRPRPFMRPAEAQCRKSYPELMRGQFR